MRSLALLGLALLLAGPLAPAQGVTFLVKPKEAGVGQFVLIVLDNSSSSTIYLRGGLPPWSVYDSSNVRVYAPADLPVASSIPPRTTMQWPWDQRDQIGVQVPTGRYEARLFYYYHGTGGYSVRASFTIKPVSLTVKNPPMPGARVELGLFARPAANLTYRVGLSFSTSPGIAVPGGRRIPLTPDGLFFLSLSGGPPFFRDFVGTLDGGGQATAYLKIPNDQRLRGYRMHAAFVAFDAAAPGGMHTISDPTAILIQ